MAYPQFVQMQQYDRLTWYADASSTLSPLRLSAQCGSILLAEDRHSVRTPKSTLLLYGAFLHYFYAHCSPTKETVANHAAL